MSESAEKNYGLWLGERIRSSGKAPDQWSEYEHWVADHGYCYDTEATLSAAYARRLKSSQGILVTEDEFIAEACKHRDDDERRQNASKAYAALADLVRRDVIKPSDVYGYACYSWCMNHPEAIIAYREAPKKWLVNNCGTEIDCDKAVLAVNREFGFEANRIQIIGTPYYDASDWMFIRFNCCGWAWLWKNGSIYLVYDE